ncbi:hypothetical protein [Salaquimonas pukyongi]|uniref:hypothetical protein n=1 Tax=Salaquimonas pukyongi TaxID=2712698 RepID=UPI00096B9E70|nr:hypothetical protein [Salaquimonas pukyongi]
MYKLLETNIQIREWLHAFDFTINSPEFHERFETLYARLQSGEDGTLGPEEIAEALDIPPEAAQVLISFWQVTASVSDGHSTTGIQ